MTETEAGQRAQEHLQTTRQPRQATVLEQGSRRLWQVTFAGDDAPPVIVTLEDDGTVLQVFEPMKMAASAGFMDIITATPEKIQDSL